MLTIYLINVSSQPLVKPFNGLFDLVEPESEPEPLSAEVGGHQGPAGILAQSFGRARMSAFPDESASSESSVVDRSHVLDDLGVLGAQRDLSRWRPEPGMSF